MELLIFVKNFSQMKQMFLELEPPKLMPIFLYCLDFQNYYCFR